MREGSGPGRRQCPHHCTPVFPAAVDLLPAGGLGAEGGGGGGGGEGGDDEESIRTGAVADQDDGGEGGVGLPWK